MQKKGKIISLIATCTIALGGAGTATAFAASNEITIDNKGDVTKVRTFENDVDKILDSENIKIQRTEKVTPSLNQEVLNNEKIIIEQLSTVNVVVDTGYENKSFNTNAQTIAEALTEAGYDTKDDKVSPALDTELVPGKTTNVTITTPKKITFTGMNGSWTAENIYSGTLGEIADKYLKNYDKDVDELSEDRETLVEQDMEVTVTRHRKNTHEQNESIPFEKKTVESDDMYKGETKVTTKGVNGVKTLTIQDTVVDGKVKESKKIDEKVTTKPVDEVTTVGTKEKETVKEEETNTDDETQKDSADTSSTKTNDTTDNSSSSDTEKKSDSSSSSSKSSAKTRESKSTASSRSSERSSTEKKDSSSSKSSGNGSGLLANIPQSKIDRFDKLAQCESTGNWSISTGMFEGGVQFLNSTWLAYGGGEFAPHAYQATREEQIYVANKLQNVTGWRSSWPGCSKKYGWN